MRAGLNLRKNLRIVPRILNRIGLVANSMAQSQRQSASFDINRSTTSGTQPLCQSC